MLEIDGAIWLKSGASMWGGAQRVHLLQAIAQTGSITAAARHVGMSYKAAWDAIDTMNNLAGTPLVERVAGGRGGGGTRLTTDALKLIEMFDAVQTLHVEYVNRLNALNERGHVTLARQLMLKTSARNTLSGEVRSITAGAVNDEVSIALKDGLEIVAGITHASVEVLALKPGTAVFALIKASSVILALPDSGMRLSARNQLAGKVDRIVRGAVNADVSVVLPNGNTISAVITMDSLHALALAEGSPALAIFKASSVIVGTLD